MDPKTLERDLTALKKVVRSRFFYCLGGEPTLHPRIVELVAVAKASGIAEKNGVITNGNRLLSMPEDFFAVLDVLRISVYPKLDQRNLQQAYEKQRRFGFDLCIERPDSFFKQFKPLAPQADEELQERFDDCPWPRECWLVHEGRFYLCPQSAFFPLPFMGSGPERDGLNLHDNLTEEKFLAFIKSKEPRRACRICCSYTEKTPWHEVSNLEDWIKASTI